MASPPSLSLTTYGRWESWPGVTRVGKLAMFFTGCNTQENWLCTLPEQQGRAGPRCALLVSWPEDLRL